MVDKNGTRLGTTQLASVGWAGASVIAAPTITFFDVANRGSYRLRGTGTPGSLVELLVDGEVVGSSRILPNGNWAFGRSLSTGDHTLIVRSLNGDGSVAGVAESKQVTVAPLALTLTADSDLEGNAIFAGTGVPNTIIELFIDGVSIGTTTVDGDGNWAFATALPLGDYDILAQDATNGLEKQLAFSHVERVENAGILTVTFTDQANGDDDTANSNDDDTTPSFNFSNATVEIILDASWSMRNPELPENGGDDGTDRIDVAKAGLTNIIEEVLPDNIPVAFRSFGNIEGNLACRTDLMYDLQPLNRAELLTIANNVEPQFNANTAIAASLLAVPNDMATANAPVLVILLTDGLETCNGDVDAAIANLKAQGFDVRVDVVGVVIEDDAARAEFQRWANLGDGVYYDATDADSFIVALSDIFARQIPISYRVLDADGTEVGHGIVGGNAIELPPGDYQISISANPPQLLDVTIGSEEEAVVEVK